MKNGGFCTEECTTRVHELKTWPQYYNLVVDQSKKFEVRRNDRGFRAGDVLFLREWDPETEKYTGRDCYVKVTFVLAGYPAIRKGYVVMSVDLDFINADQVQSACIEATGAVEKGGE